MERQLLTVLTMTAFREYRDALLVLLYNLNRLMNPRQVGVLTVDRDASRVTQEEPEATLLETVFRGKIMYLVFAEHRSHHRPVEMAGVVDDEQRRAVKFAPMFLEAPRNKP
jgi:hypothetical protein